MDKITRTELVDYNALLTLLFSDLLDDNKNMKGEHDTAYKNELRYKYAYLLTEYGRNTFERNFTKYCRIPTVYINSDNRRFTKGVSLQNLDGLSRNLLIQDFCYDADIVNCNPSLLLSVLNGASFDTEFLKKYVNSRDKVFHKVIKGVNKLLSGKEGSVEITKKHVKDLIIIITNGGSLNTWLSKHKLGLSYSDIIENINFISGYISENKRILNYIHDNPKQFNTQEVMEQMSNEPNMKGKLLNRVILRAERQCIDILEAEIEKSDFVINSIIHDGINVYHKSMIKSDKIQEQLEGIFTVVEERILEMFKYDVKIICKPLDVKNILLSNYVLPKQHFDEFNLRYMSKFKSYDTMKAYFELFFGYVKGSNVYYEISKTFSNTYDVTSIKQLLDGAYVSKFNSEKQKNEKKPFFNVYRNDPSRKIYSKAGFYLGDEHTRENAFNIFIPLPDLPKKPETYNTHIKHYRKLIGLAIGDEHDKKGYVEYMIQWFSDMIQNPSNKSTSTSIVISGEQGTGKSSLSEILMWIFTSQRIYCEASGKILHDGFNGSLMGKMLLNMEESEGDDSLTGRIKQFTTSKLWQYEFKNKNKMTAPNYTRLMFASNKKVPVYIDSATGDRRFVVFESKNPTNRTVAFFKHFFNAYDPDGKHHRDFCDAVYNYLYNYPITIKNFQDERPITEAYRKLMLRCVSHKIQFIINFVETCKFECVSGFDDTDIKDYGNYWECDRYNMECKVTKTALFEHFKMYIQDEFNNRFKKLNRKEFFNDIMKHFKFTEKKIRGERFITFKPSEIMKVALKKNWLITHEGQVIKSINIKAVQIDEQNILDF